MVSASQTVALIATVRNEMPDLPIWLECIHGQSRTPDEIVIVDGGSTDGTWQRLQQWANDAGARVISVPGANISEGRNRAISEVSSDIVVVTDAGTSAASDWIEQLVCAFDDARVDVASGFFEPELNTAWDRALAATTLPDVAEVDPGTFLPSSRSLAFRRSWWQCGVRYPAWLDYCEDIVWDLSMKRAGANFRFVPGARVRFRVRPSVRSHAVQYYRYARGDGKAGLFPLRHLIRYATYAGVMTVLLRSIRIESIATLMLGGLYVRKPIARIWKRDRRSGVTIHSTLLLSLTIPALRVIGDIAKMTGYPVGLRWRWRTYGTIGWKTSWQRISPDGTLWRPGEPTRRSQPPTSWPGA